MGEIFATELDTFNLELLWFSQKKTSYFES